MYRARRIWEFPQRSHTSVDNPRTKDVHMVDIPQELCVEFTLADPLLVLHSVALPQILHQLERYLTVASFVEHTVYNYPILGNCVSTLPIGLITEALSAKSCSEAITYDRLEWVGDGVLKLLHTDALLKWRRTAFLHEGYLSLLRSGKYFKFY
jgi:dsRNA-specific ribonuclease